MRDDQRYLYFYPQFIIAASLQLRMMFTTHMTSDKVSDGDVTRLSNCLVNALLTLFSGPSFAKNVSCDVLKDLIQVEFILSNLIQVEFILRDLIHVEFILVIIMA